MRAIPITRHVLARTRSNPAPADTFTYRSGVMLLTIARYGVDLTMQNKLSPSPGPARRAGLFCAPYVEWPGP